MNAGLYVHIPFCLKKCNYCDFISTSATNHIKMYPNFITKEILLRKEKWQSFVFDTIYFGGGTPSILKSQQLQSIFDEIRENFVFSDMNIEKTIEVNPETITKLTAKELFSVGFSRISIGVQSFDDIVLKKSGRIQNAKTAEKAYILLREAGFRNINLDFILGLPEEREETIEMNLKKIQELSPDHISLYCISVAKNTPLYNQLKKKETSLPSEDDFVYRWEWYIRELKKMRYMHYEISNFAKKNNQSRHNLHYWHGDPYLGLGVSAVSSDLDKRYTNSKDIDLYAEKLNQNESPITHTEILDAKIRQKESVMLGLRLLQEGVSIFTIQKKDFTTISYWENQGLLQRKDQRLLLTEKGVFVSNQIICSMM